MNLPRVVIIGRMNVGKSTLFNRLIGERKAITSEVAGTTRDRLSGVVSWLGREFTLTDTGGLDISQAEEIEQNIVRQAQVAIKSADLILFVVNVRDGLMPQERELVKRLRKATQPIILVANKCDSPRLRPAAREFKKLGLDEAIPISSTTGAGTGDLLDLVIRKLQIQNSNNQSNLKFQTPNTIRVAIVGRPNVGKSSILNALVGSERAIVTSIPGTTREVIDEVLETPAGNFVLIDTAGIRKKLLGLRSKGRIKTKGVVSIEEEAVRRSLEAVRRADVCLLVLDITERIAAQDKRIAREIVEAGAGALIVLNKFDLVANQPTRDGRPIEEVYEQYIRGHFPHLDFAPIAFTSTIKQEGVDELLPAITRIAQARAQTIPQTELDSFLQKFLDRLGKPKMKADRRNIHITHIRQERTHPPEFIVSLPKKAVTPKALLPMLENALRNEFDFVGTPIQLRTETI